MTDWSQRYDDASDEVDAFLREKGIELPEEEDGDKSPAYNNSARRMLFSGDYSNDAKKKLEGAQCPNPMNNSGCTGTEDLTLDHGLAGIQGRTKSLVYRYRKSAGIVQELQCPKRRGTV